MLTGNNDIGMANRFGQQQSVQNSVPSLLDQLAQNAVPSLLDMNLVEMGFVGNAETRNQLHTLVNLSDRVCDLLNRQILRVTGMSQQNQQ